MTREERAVRLKRKSFAVVSGKGGVGKTTTAVNLALYAARKGLRTGLLDLDPLSDTAALLDIGKPENAVRAEEPERQERSGERETASENGTEKNRLGAYTIQTFSNFDLLFPSQKLSRQERDDLYRLIFEDFAEALDAAYDLLVFDMPAGSDFDENIRFLPAVERILLVTNPEPTAHVAAGHFIKEALASLSPEPSPFLVWHNRFDEQHATGFDPRDIVGTYNSNVAEDDHLTPGVRERLTDIAFIPPDHSLDLLQGTPDLPLLILRNILSVLVSMQEARTAEHTGRLPFSKNIREILRYRVSGYGEIEDIDETLSETGEYLRELLLGRMTTAGETGAADLGRLSLFTATEEEVLRLFFESLRADELRTALVKAVRVLEREVRARAEAGKLFSAPVAGQDPAAVDRALTELLVRLNDLGELPDTLRNFGGLLVFHFSLSKLFRSETVTDLVYRIIPKKSDRKGRELRDRNAQIRSIVRGDTAFRQAYLELVRKLYPIATHQVSTVIKTFSLDRLVFRGNDGANTRAYLMLLTTFLHDAVNSGLGIIVGFDYRPAASAFRDGAEKLLNELHIPDGTA